MPGVKPQEKTRKVWSPELAYAVGLLATDGSLSKDGRHLDFTSKDKEQIKNFLKCLSLKNKIGKKSSGHSKKRYSRVQFGDIIFYRFLLEIGLTPAKSKTLGPLDIPDKYFFDFLRGSFDGDGTFYSYYDPRWPSSFMFYTVFASASRKYIDWIRQKLFERVGIKGHISHHPNKSEYELKYAKRESSKLLKKMYYTDNLICLKRKRLKVRRALSIVGLKL